MALVQKADPRKKLIVAAFIDVLLVGLGVAIFVVSGSPIWIILGIGLGTIVSVPMIMAAMRELKEQKNASR